MSKTGNILGLIGTGIAILVWIGILGVVVLLDGDPVLAVLGVLMHCLSYCWMLSAYFYYRDGRQEELLQVLAALVEADAPLAPALWAYLDDRPRGVWRETWVFFLLLFVVPGYYWFRYRRHSYDAKTARVAARLEQGYLLADALQAVPGVVPRDAVLSVAIGESTGHLAGSLRGASRARLAAAWMEIIPRVVYPFLVMLITTGVLTFWAIYIAPKMENICSEMGVALPEMTVYVMRGFSWLSGYGGLVFLLVMTLIGMGCVLASSSFLLWYCPGVGRLYQMHLQHRVLHLLALPIESGKPLPEALEYLAESSFGSLVLRWKLRAVQAGVEEGDALAPTLCRHGLLPRHMVPLVQSAEKVGNLAWALAALGESRGNRLARILRHGSTLLWPVVVSLIGAVVGFIALGMFYPLIDLMTRLG